ncbi:MAG: T9SS type A sorting domain-containing protein [Bacteroidales bacterium]
MKTKVFLSACTMILIMCVTVLYAQPGLGPCFRESKNPAPCTELPDLTQEQKAGIESLQKQFRDEMKSLRESGEFSKEEIREKFLVNRSELHREIEALLTPKQIEVKNQRVVNDPILKHHNRSLPPFDRLTKEHDHFLLMESRIEFEKKLTPEEKEVIAAMRIKVSDHLELMRSLKPGEITQAERNEIRSKHIGSLQPLRDIAHKYQSELLGIRRNMGFESQPICPNIKSKPAGRRFQNRTAAQPDAYFPGIRFLLLEPTGKDDQPQGSSPEEIRIYPNPTSKSFKVEFELDQPGNVKIELLNKAGEVIEILEQAIRNAGSNIFSYEGDLLINPGVYFIRVKTSEKTMTRKLIRN